MNPLSLIKNLLRSVIGKTNDVIDRIPERHAKSIRQTYFFAVFVLAAGGVFLGRHLGGDAAGIKMPPLASTVKDVFEYDIYKERGSEADFDLMIESEMMSGQESKVADKIAFPAKEPFEMEYEGGIVDYKSSKQTSAPEMEMNYQPLEGKYAEPMGRPETQVAPLNKRLEQAESNIRVKNNNAAKTDSIQAAPLQSDTPKENPVKTETKAADVPVNGKRTPENKHKDSFNFKPLTDGAGILE